MAKAALRKLNKQIEAISIGPDKKRGEVKSVAGFFVGGRYGIGADPKKKKKGSNLFQFVDEKGERFDVWGNASIDGALLDSRGKIDSALNNKWIEIAFVKLGKKQPGKNPQKICDVYCDDSRTRKVTK